MKKITLEAMILMFLASCTELVYYETDTYYQEQEKILAKDKDIFKTMDIYRKICPNNYSKDKAFIVHFSSNPQYTCCRKAPNTLEHCGMTEELCKQYLFKDDDEDKICNFNYDKYLPAETVKNAKDFMDLYNLYEYSYLKRNRWCKERYPNKLEQQNCEEENKKIFLSKAEKIQKRPVVITDMISAKQREEIATKNRNVMQALELYWDLYQVESGTSSFANGCERGKTGNYLNIIKLFARSDSKPQCAYNTINNQDEYNSDECILYRRNINKLSEICFFDYKKYLPKNSKISNDEQFINLITIYRKLFRSKQAWDDEDIGFYEYVKTYSHCDLLKEVTTQERKQCQDDDEKFIFQIVNGTAPYCKDKVPEQYKNELKYTEFSFDFEIAHRCIMY